MRDFLELIEGLKGRYVRLCYYIPDSHEEAEDVSGLLEGVEGHMLRLSRRSEMDDELHIYLNLDMVAVYRLEVLNERGRALLEGLREMEDGEAGP